MTIAIQQSTIRNRLIQSLSAADFAAIAPDLRPMALPMAGIVEEAGEAVDRVIFLTSGIASRIVRGHKGSETESGHIGREGMTGRSVVLESAVASERIQMQVAGEGLTLSAAQLLDGMAKSKSLRRLALRYVQASQVQTEHTLLAATSYAIPERLARWLLMYNDRVDGSQFPVTHELLASMLDVRRAGVTTAIHILEGERAVRSARGRITILDRARLIELAGGCYGIPEQHYERLIPANKPGGRAVSARGKGEPVAVE